MVQDLQWDSSSEELGVFLTTMIIVFLAANCYHFGWYLGNTFTGSKRIQHYCILFLTTNDKAFGGKAHECGLRLEIPLSDLIWSLSGMQLGVWTGSRWKMGSLFDTPVLAAIGM